MSDRNSIPLEFYNPQNDEEQQQQQQQFQQQDPEGFQPPQQGQHQQVQFNVNSNNYQPGGVITEEDLDLIPIDNHLSYAQMTIKQRILEDFLGYSVREKKAKVPEGFQVSYTKNGTPYLQSIVLEKREIDDIKAAEEHTKFVLPLTCNIQEIEEHYGTGIYMYFNFILFCIGINFVLLALVLVNLVPHFYYGVKNDSFKDFSNRDLLLIAFNIQSYYREEVRPYYFYSTIACVVLSFIMGPLYSWKINRYFKKYKLHDYEDGYEGDDIIHKNTNVSHGSRIFRFTVSYIVFCLLLGASAVASVFILKFVNNYIFLTNILTTSLVSAIVLRVINVIYEFLCSYLTMFERHRNWTNFRNHNTLKLFVFKIINVIILYILRDEVFSKYTQETILNGCPLVEVGSQFLFILVLDLTLQNVWEIIYALMLDKIGRAMEKRGKKSTDSYKPDFDLSDEYLEVLYRQFIICLGIPIYPFVTVFGIVCNLVEYYVDRFKLFRICKKPARLQGSMKKFLSFYLLIVAVVAVVTYPYGSGWVLIQLGLETGKLHNNCDYLFTNTIPL
ncbi:DUF590 family protein [Tieghemostelium lacteum]|uniref:DUF590 family protein n=1 Tax=Tieghemostelium lacteum TaxID=361077 RepID=A0A152A8X3_TIELA|nr:DUF590 family protein [Tieghemostelium lacteum]|eukprot:KYR02672.1 DUF590 family protein [Tieghemostelium lacteum]